MPIFRSVWGCPPSRLTAAVTGRGAHSLDESFDTTNSHLGTQRALLILLGIVGVK